MRGQNHANHVPFAHVLPVSRTPIEIPMLDMNAVRSTACLQKGMAHIPNAVSSIEQPGKTENKRKSLDFSVVEAKCQENCDVNLTDVARWMWKL